jgi:hypothetical protein
MKASGDLKHFGSLFTGIGLFFGQKKHPINDRIKKQMMQVAEKDILRCFAVSFTNDFSHSLPNGGQV